MTDAGKVTRRSLLGVVVVAAPLGWLWQRSLPPDRHSILDMGYADLGNGVPHLQHHDAHATAAGTAERSLTTLISDPGRPADVAVTLTARHETVRLPSGRTVAAYTLDHLTPGPKIRATVGQLVQVTLLNESVAAGATLHWHGLDVPNAMDGVAGVTQDAVPVGGTFTYRFVAAQPGSFWYHSHQVSSEQVRGGLLGPVTILPAGGVSWDVDVVAVAHLYGGLRTLNGRDTDVQVPAGPGQEVRLRMVNTDDAAASGWVVGAPFRVLAVDGVDLVAPPEVTDRSVGIAAGGRVDLGVRMPSDGRTVRVHVSGPTGVVLTGGYPPPAPEPQPRQAVDLLAYGTPTQPRFDPDRATRRFTYDIGRAPGFVRGVPGIYWTVNGHLYPDVPMFHVAEGDLVRMTITNHSGEPHPMHLHGHHAVVVSRNGVRSSGSPWWVDSLTVAHQDSYDIAFMADNPGLWMDHCHNLVHASQGLTAHLVYEGITTPFRMGHGSGNEPE